jgi:hypothetical protein
LQLEEQIPLRQVAGRLDHFTADAKRRRLIVSALGNNTVEVIDVFAVNVDQSIKGLNEPQLSESPDGKLSIAVLSAAPKASWITGLRHHQEAECGLQLSRAQGRHRRA